MSSEVERIDVLWRGRQVAIEYGWLARERDAAPLIVFLHEGLGSRSAWRDFPERLCESTGCRGLVYSRPGYGQSTPRAVSERWRNDYLHRQAHEVLPTLLAALGIDPQREQLWLCGHSDGGSIALLYAARWPGNLAGCITLAPHVFVEDLSVRSITATREAFLTTDMKARLARHHADPDATFWGWCDIWLDPEFRRWNIEREIAAVTCPLLVVQGLDDPYGTLAQIHGIKAMVPHAQLLELPACGHSVHRDQPDMLLAAATDFLRRHTTPR